MNELRDDQLLTIVKNVVEQHGCKLVDIDFETHSLNIEGPEDAQAECALALEKVLAACVLVKKQA
jgi:ribosome maturation factor RimP